MPSKRLSLIALVAAAAPTPALAHAGILAGPDPVAALVHFVGQPDHAAGLMLLAAGALALSPRLRAAAKSAIRRLRRR